MPPDDGLGLDQCQRLLPISPVSRQENPKGSISIREVGPFCVSFQDFELMPEREVFQGQYPAGPQRGEQRAEQDEYHRGYDMMESP